MVIISRTKLSCLLINVCLPKKATKNVDFQTNNRMNKYLILIFVKLAFMTIKLVQLLAMKCFNQMKIALSQI